MTTKKRVPRTKLREEFLDLSGYEWEYLMPGVVSNLQQTVGWFRYLADRVKMLREEFGQDAVELQDAESDLRELAIMVEKNKLFETDRRRIQKDVQRIGRDLLYFMNECF